MIDVLAQPPTLGNGRLEQLIQIEMPPRELANACMLTAHWRGPTTQGDIGPLSPTDAHERSAFWRIEAEVGAIDVVSVQSRLTCGRLARGIAERWGGTSEAAARYCALCPMREPVTPAAPREHGRRGIGVTARVGAAIEARGTSVVDRCSGNVLVDLSDVQNVSVIGGTDRESEMQALLASDHGDDVCARPVVPGEVQIELLDEAVGTVGARFTPFSQLSVVFSLWPIAG